MVRVYRCSLGHTWTPSYGSMPATATCPVCGNTAALTADSTPEGRPLPPDFEVTRPFPAAAPEPPKPAANDQTSPYLALPSSEEPSFSSLTGTPGSSLVEFSPRPEPGDMPTLDYAPPLVPGYEIQHEVGRGGMGVVYKARQVSLNRPVALKMILAGAHAGPTERERFKREAEAVAALQHPHIVQIFEVGEANGHQYFALEFVEGGSLAQHLAGTPWPARESAELVELLARAVHYAHSQGVVHRDLKPGNVLLQVANGDGRAVGERGAAGPPLGSRPADLAPRPKITDFGLAKRLDSNPGDGGTRTGAVMGTPSYIAPEQASGKGHAAGAGVDVYALGAILYECLTGRPPFRAETPLETVLLVLNEDPVPPKRLQPAVPRDLETICLKCLSKNPAKRYPSALALAEDLRRFLAGEPIKARPLSAWGRGVKWARRHPALTALGVVTIAATVSLLGVLSVAYARVADAVKQKEAEADAARQAKADEERQRHIAEDLARENEKARQAAVTQAEQLKQEAERTRRAAYALQLSQIAAMCERDPKRAVALLEDPDRCPAEFRDFTWGYLRRLCHREERVYAEHDKGDRLLAVAYAPGGTFVATGGEKGIVRLWDPRTGRTWAVLIGHRGAVRGIAFSPDGGALATAGADGTVRLWEVPAEVLDMARRTMSYLSFLDNVVKPFLLMPAITIRRAHQGAVNCVAFHPGGDNLVSGGADGSVRIWELIRWRGSSPVMAALGGAAAVVHAATQSAGGSPYRPIRSVEDRGGAILSVCYNPTGDLAASGDSDRSAQVWSPDGSRAVFWRSWTFGGPVSAVTFSADGRTVAAANNGPTPTIRLLTAERGTITTRLVGHGGTILALAISPDGQFLASAGADRTVRLWDMEEGKERAMLTGHTGPVTGLAFGPDRRSVVSVSEDGTARVWRTVVRPNEEADVTGSRDILLSAAAVGGNGGTFIFGEKSGRVSVRLADVLPGRPTAPGTLSLWPVPVDVPPRTNVLAAAAAPDGRAVLAATPDALLVWRIFQLRPRGKGPGGPVPLPTAQPLRLPTPRPVTAMAVHPTGSPVATLDEEGVRLWDLESLPLLHDRTYTAPPPRLILKAADVRDVTFCGAEGDCLAVAVGNGLRIVNRSGKVVAEVPDAHATDVVAVAAESRGTMLATADAAGLIRVWRLQHDGGLGRVADLEGHAEPVRTLAFSPDGRTLASGGEDRAVILWDPLSGNERAVLSGHANQVLRVQFTPDGGSLVTIGLDGMVKRWRAEPATSPARVATGP